MSGMRLPLFVCLAFLLFSIPAHSVEKPEEEFVKEFYLWYINEKTKQKHPLDSDRIYNYVYACTVNNVRMFYLKGYIDADYFTKTQDVWPEWLEALQVHSAIKLSDTTSIVPVSLTWPGGDEHHLIVFVQEQGEGLRITKVVGTQSVEE